MENISYANFTSNNSDNMVTPTLFIYLMPPMVSYIVLLYDGD